MVGLEENLSADENDMLRCAIMIGYYIDAANYEAGVKLFMRGFVEPYDRAYEGPGLRETPLGVAHALRVGLIIPGEHGDYELGPNFQTLTEGSSI